MKKIIRTALALLLCCALLPLPAAYAATDLQPAASEGADLENPVSEQGSVTAPDSPISTAEGLMALAAYINGGGESSGMTWTLSGNIDLTGYTWPGIGTVNIAFQGTFDGAGYTVTLPEGSSCGLFGYAKGAQIRKVTVAGRVTSSAHSVGGVVGHAEDTTVEDCVNQADIVRTTTADDGYTGGVVGRAEAGAEARAVIRNCRNEGDLSGTCHQFGGIVGHTDGVPVTGCRNTGDISGTGVYIGGIVGRVEKNAAVNSCWNTGSVTGESDSVYRYLGGIIGFGSDLSIEACWNAGNIHASSGSMAGYCGGVAGAIHTGVLENCYNMGTATADSALMFVGGMVGGLSDGTVQNAYDAGGSAKFLGSDDGETTQILNCAKQGQSDESATSMSAAALTAGTVPFEAWEESIWECAPGMYPRLAVSATDNESIVWAAAAVENGDILTLSAFDGGQWTWGETELQEGTSLTLPENAEVVFTREGLSKSVPVAPGTYTVDLMSGTAQATLEVSIGTMVTTEEGTQWVPAESWKEGESVNAQIRVENGSGHYTYTSLAWTTGLILKPGGISGTVTGFPGSTVQVRVYDTDTGAYGISNVVTIGYSGGVVWQADAGRVYDGTALEADWYLENGQAAAWSASYVYWRKTDTGYEETTPANSGADTVGGAPVWAGTYRAVCWRDEEQIGETAADFTIVPRTLTAEDLDMTALEAAAEYNGGAVTKDKEDLIASTLLRAEDLDVTYDGNTAPGMATVTVTGLRNFSGSVSGSFEIRLGTQAAQEEGGLSLTLEAGTAYTLGGDETTRWYLADQPEVLYFGGTVFYVPRDDSYQFYISKEDAA